MKRVSIAVVHGDPPQVYVAEDMDVLHWVLALKVVGSTQPGRLRPDEVEFLREAILEERWAEAVFEWMTMTRNVIDVFDHHEHYITTDVEMASSELQFLPLFRDNRSD